MKRFLLVIAVAIVSMAIGANAQTVSADFSKMDQLVEKLGKSIEKAPKKSGVADIDQYVDGAQAAAVGAVATAEKLHNLYSRQIGESADGVTDVTVTKPTLNDWIELGTAVATQTTGVTALADAGVKAGKAVKDAPKMKAVGLAKNVKWSGDVLPVVGEALAEQTKAINEIINTLKSGDNL
ncbi:MAG: hypothetical protein NC453_23530 [Muribaculum sp.]|nr:hypothetical protein [Muribaculum sp.]